ncbi:hypothetical protein KRX19_09210 [Cardiobacteriaceae bacterium TAE3-ERU3]|nr:hypothetical protein [Cardiobacteriaceae bacterium TAE3-ERU3]
MNDHIFSKLEVSEALHADLTLRQCGEIDVLVLSHAHCEAAVSLQGAQLLHWRPATVKQNVIWLSEVEPFKAGHAIRGGVPICYPWFGKADGEPAHGTARIRNWSLDDWQIGDEGAILLFGLYDDHGLEATLHIQLGEACMLTLTHQRDTRAQAALHSYFQIGDITQTHVSGLPTSCFDANAQQQSEVPSPREIDAPTDCIYQIEQPVQCIHDHGNQRTITLVHKNASDTVLWNPWYNTPSAMRDDAYKEMLCLETARINRPLLQGESLSVSILVNAAISTD